MREKLEKVLEQSFLDYSSYVIQRRAIPDARDGLKYTARQILHAQQREKLDHKHPFKKSLKSVSAATSFSYVHGGTSAYEQIIRMGRPLVQRYFLEEINGNGGTPTGSSTYSADRYTEARLSELTSYLFDGIEQNTIAENDWELTYDEEGMFPKVLPSLGYYNIVNGSYGSIAPTMISSIPQFNLREINLAIISLINDKENRIDLLPDFSSGGILLNPQTTKESLMKGEGKSALLRGKININEKEKFIDILELPYGVYTDTVCQEIEKAMENGNCPVVSFKDLSRRTVHIRIYGENLDKLEKWLYKNTSVQKHFTIKMIMLDEGKTPKLFNIKTALLAHIDHVRLVWRRALGFQLQQLKDRQEIIEGLLKAYSIIDEVIATIKGSNGRVDAVNLLINQFQFTRNQAEAIVDLRLHRLSSIDIQKLQEELKSNIESQTDIQDTLNTKKKFDQQLINIYEEVARKFGDSRRTKIFEGTEWESGQEGEHPDKNYFISYDDEMYSVSYLKDNDRKLSVSVKLKEKVFFITNQLRGFYRLVDKLYLGDNKFLDSFKLNEGEKIIQIYAEHEVIDKQHLEIVCENGDEFAMHQSCLLVRASERGKKLCKKNLLVKEVSLINSDKGYKKIT